MTNNANFVDYNVVNRSDLVKKSFYALYTELSDWTLQQQKTLVSENRSSVHFYTQLIGTKASSWTKVQVKTSLRSVTKTHWLHNWGCKPNNDSWGLIRRRRGESALTAALPLKITRRTIWFYYIGLVEQWVLNPGAGTLQTPPAPTAGMNHQQWVARHFNNNSTHIHCLDLFSEVMREELWLRRMNLV